MKDEVKVHDPKSKFGTCGGWSVPVELKNDSKWSETIRW